jgi:TetR/AcrR family transcriptional repressor of nem operon
MKSVGLTNGAFYYHFSSRENMIAQAIERALPNSYRRLAALRESHTPTIAIQAHIECYLSPEYRDTRNRSCPISSLSAHIATLGDESRRAFEYGAAKLTSLLALMLHEVGQPEAGSLAISILSEMMGALSLSRLIADPIQSEEVLRICRISVLQRALSAR